jgi:hypothetical protein
MTDPTIGRLLVAPLHQAITDVLPGRTEFYEYWLTGAGLRGGTIGRAPLLAVLSFLRAEGEAYDAVMARAGELAGDWAVEGTSAFYLRLAARLPLALRLRAAIGLAARVNQRGFSATRTVVTVRRGVARIEVRDSIFCQVREIQPHPLCGYHSALVGRVLSRFNLPARVTIDSCRASGAAACVITVTMSESGPTAGPGSES